MTRKSIPHITIYFAVSNKRLILAQKYTDLNCSYLMVLAAALYKKRLKDKPSMHKNMQHILVVTLPFLESFHEPFFFEPKNTNCQIEGK